jgi:hypothetical protein
MSASRRDIDDSVSFRPKALRIYDVTIDEYRPATQDDIDRMQTIIQALMIQPLPHDPGDTPAERLTFDLAIYPNRMRSDGVFVAERKTITAYPNARGLRGEPLYPSVPDTQWHLGTQLPLVFAEEIVRRWNAANVQRHIKERVS